MTPARSRVAAAAAVVATLAVYLAAGTAGFGFVNYDDPAVVYENPAILSGTPLAAFTDLMAHAWLPLYSLSLALDHVLFGPASPGAWHLHSLLWHLLNVVLVWALVRRLGLDGLAAAGAALLFGLHPAVTESVAWVASRKDLVSFAFAAGAALCYLDGEGETRRPSRHLWGAALLALGMLAKGSVVVLPGLLMLHALHLPADEGRRSAALRAVIPYALVAAVLAAVHLAIAGQAGTVGAMASSGDGTGVRILSGAAALWMYLRLLLVPAGLNVEHGLVPAEVPGAAVVGGAVCLVAMVAGAVVLCRRGHRGASAALMAVLVALAPFNGVFPRTSVVLAERYLYVAAAVAAGLGGWCLATVGRRLPVASLPTLVVAAVFGTLTFQHLPVWRDSLSLWEASVSGAPRAHLSQAKLGEALAEAALDEGDEERRRVLFEEAAAAHGLAADLARTPLDEMRSRQNLGLVMLGLGRPQEALDAMERASVLMDGLGEAASQGVRIGLAVNHAKALESTGRRDEARERLEETVRRWPGAAAAWLNLGVLRRDGGDFPGARQALEQAVSVDPTLQEALLARVDLEALAGDFPAAQRAAVRAVEADPTSVAALVKAGEVAHLLGQPLKAETWFTKAHDLDPGHAGARRGLAGATLQRAGSALARGEASQAAELARRACELDPEGPSPWFILGDALRLGGDTVSAADAYERAAALGSGDRARNALAGMLVAQARALHEAGDPAGAREVMERALAGHPTRVRLGHSLPVVEEGLERVPAAPAGGDARPHLLDGLLALCSGETGRAVASLSTSLGMARAAGGGDGLVGASLILRSRARLADGDLDSAVGDLRALVALDEKREGGARFSFLLGHALSARSSHRRQWGDLEGAEDDVAEAVEVLTEARERDPSLEEASIALAELHFTGGRLVDAIRELNGVLRRDPERVEAHLVLANIMKSQFAETEESSFLQEAEASFRRALGIDPEEARALVGLGEVAAFGGKAREALVYALRALSVDPDLPQARSLAALLFVRSGRSRLEGGDVDGAEAAVKRADELHGETAALCLLRADVHRARGRWVEAGVEVERARALEPANPDVRDAVATHYRDVGYAFLLRTAEDEAQRRHYRIQAEEAFRRALDADPPRVDLTEVRRLLERGNEGPRIPEGSAALAEAFDRALAEARRLLDEGAAALRDGEPELAVERFRASLGQYEHPPTRFALGLALSALERTEEAERAFEMAVDVDPRYAEAWLNLGGLRYRREDWKGAEKAYLEYLRNVPENADPGVVEQVQTLVLACRKRREAAGGGDGR